MFNLFYNYYIDKNEKRAQEILYCLNKNKENKLLNVHITNSQEKLTYKYFFEQINQITTDCDINIICNADIYFDETIELAKNINVDEAYVLSRWNVCEDDITLYDKKDSQDAWIFKGKVRYELAGDFFMGTLGCDNRLAYEIVKAGYKIKNPAKSIKAIHVHMSNLRNYVAYENEKRVPPPYWHISPTSLDIG